MQDRGLVARVGIKARDEDQSIGIGSDLIFVQIARDSTNRYQKWSREVIGNSGLVVEGWRRGWNAGCVNSRGPALMVESNPPSDNT